MDTGRYGERTSAERDNQTFSADCSIFPAEANSACAVVPGGSFTLAARTAAAASAFHVSAIAAGGFSALAGDGADAD